MASCHPTYIGQIERGEKNATLDTIAKIAAALNLSFTELFQFLEQSEREQVNYPLKCYQLIAEKDLAHQEKFYEILRLVDKL